MVCADLLSRRQVTQFQIREPIKSGAQWMEPVQMFSSNMHAKKKDAKWQTDVRYIQMWPPPHCWYSVQSFSVMHHVGFSLTASVFTTEHLLNQQRRIEWAFSPHPRRYGALMSNTLDEKYTLSTLASVAQGLLGHDIYYAPSRGVGVAFPAGPHTALLTFENSAWNTAVI